MMEVVSGHAAIRMQQRGFQKADLDTVLRFGTRMGDAVLLTAHDAAEATTELRQQIARVERLKGAAVFLEGRTVVSVYRPTRWKVRRLGEGYCRRRSHAATREWEHR
jgi:hypothetical protein